jgi:LDH2 family malate/lactate/ureidoglycolate dehydrogenase
MMMDIFGGLITGASFAGGVRDQYKEVDKPQGVGHWFLVFKPDMFLDSVEEYRERMDTLLEAVRSSQPAAGVERIYTPGEIEEATRQAREREGIPFTRAEVETLHGVAEEWGSNMRLDAS